MGRLSSEWKDIVEASGYLKHKQIGLGEDGKHILFGRYEEKISLNKDEQIIQSMVIGTILIIIIFIPT